MSDANDWDALYQSGEFEHWEFDYPSPELVALVAAGFIPGGARVLDAGCGGGHDAIFLAGSGCAVIGVDISATALEIACRRARDAGVSVDWGRASVLDLPLADASIDVACDRGVFHILEDADRPRYASALARVLKPGGRLLLRGASEEVSAERFNPVTAAAIDHHFGPPQFHRGPVLPLPLLSVAGVMGGRMVVLTKEIPD
jgi:ubiquinone/menaquinone biosynthesis C-methylase UbiE